MPVFVHVIPTAVARGAQVHARALADFLDGPDSRHLVLCLFDGPTDVEPDLSLRADGGRRPGVGFDPRVALRLRSEIRRLGARAVVAHGGDALKYAIWTSGSAPVVFHAIGTFSAPARSGAGRLMWKAMIARASAVAAISQDVARECTDVIGAGRTRLVVIPNGRDPEVFHPRDDRDGDTSDGSVPLVLFVGRLTPGKRPDLFVSLIERLRARGSALRAALVGEGPLRPSLEASAEAAEVEILGQSDDVAAMLRTADLLVFPSEPEGEGMPGVLIEAGLSGLPVVATDVAGVRDVVVDGETGSVVEKGDFESIVDATAALVGDRERRRTMGKAARERCEQRFSIEASARGWSSLLETLGTRR